MHTLPQPPNLKSYTWRPAQRSDAPAIYQLFLDTDAHDNRHWAGTLAEWESEFDDPDMDFTRDTLIALTEEGQAAALGWVYAPRKVENKHRAFLWPDVHPDHRTPALEDFIIRWCEARGQEILAERRDERPRLMRGGAMLHDQRRIAWFRRQGFEPIRYFFQMRRDLGQAIVDPILPPGLSLQSWTPALDDPTFAAFNESFRDHWGFEPVSKANWDLYFIGRDGFRPDFSYVVLAGEEVAGFSLNYYTPEVNERKGVDEAWIGDLGVRRPWRRQGVATALLNQSMHTFRQAGIAHAALGVDSENPTGALNVYKKVGFEVVEESVGLGKRLPLPEPVPIS